MLQTHIHFAGMVFFRDIWTTDVIFCDWNKGLIVKLQTKGDNGRG